MLLSLLVLLILWPNEIACGAAGLREKFGWDEPADFDDAELLQQKATPQELEDYKRFVLNAADKVANAHREGGETVSADEHAAIDAIAANLGTTAP